MTASKRVAKLVIIDPEDNYLLMYRSDHPEFGEDPDLPGGTLENGEEPLGAMIREVQEEAGVDINPTLAKRLYIGKEYSKSGTEYSLYIAKLSERPTITMSWEHSSYEWLSKDEFQSRAKSAKDTYMHMVHDVLAEQ